MPSVSIDWAALKLRNLFLSSSHVPGSASGEGHTWALLLLAWWCLLSVPYYGLPGIRWSVVGSLSLQLIVAGLALVFSVFCICDHQIQPYLRRLRTLHPRGVRFYRPSIRTSPIRHDLVCFVPPTSPQRVSILVGCGQTLDDAIYSLVLITARLP